MALNDGRFLIIDAQGWVDQDPGGVARHGVTEPFLGTQVGVQRVHVPALQCLFPKLTAPADRSELGIGDDSLASSRGALLAALQNDVGYLRLRTVSIP